MKKLLSLIVVLLAITSAQSLFSQINMYDRVYGFNHVSYYGSFDYFDKTDPFTIESVTTDVPVFLSAGDFTNEGNYIAIGVYETSGMHILNVKHNTGFVSEGALVTPWEQVTPNYEEYIKWSGMACDKNSSKVYVVAQKWNDYVGSLFGKLNPITGDITVVSEVPISSVSDIAIDNDGVIYAISNKIGETPKSWTIDKATGEFTELGTLDQTPKYDLGMTCDPESGKIIVSYSLTGLGDGNIAELDKTTGKLINIVPQGFYHYYDEIGIQAETVSIDNNETEIATYELKQNYPNPFNPTTQINYELGITNYESAKIVVSNAMGQIVWSSQLTAHSSQLTGSILFDGSSFNSGVYYYSLVVDGKKMDTRKMILTK